MFCDLQLGALMLKTSLTETRDSDENYSYTHTLARTHTHLHNHAHTHTVWFKTSVDPSVSIRCQFRSSPPDHLLCRSQVCTTCFSLQIWTKQKEQKQTMRREIISQCHSRENITLNETFLSDLNVYIRSQQMKRKREFHLFHTDADTVTQQHTYSICA